MHKYNTDNQAVTYNFNLTFKGDQYIMNESKNLLKGKKGIIFGALNEHSIAWKAAERIYEEGGKFVLTNIPLAIRFGEIKDLAKKCRAEVVSADATNVTELEHLVDESTKILGGKIDFILHSPAMSTNIRKKKLYNDINYEWFLKTLDVSALSFHKIMQVLYNKDAMNEWSSILAITYIAAQRTFPGYSDMTEAKAMLESIARNFGYIFAKKKVRVNTISQSPTKTTASSGIGMFDLLYDYAEKMSPLGNADHTDFANYAIMMFSDFTRKITMQNLMNDGGFSTCGVSEALLDEKHFVKDIIQ